MEIKKINLFEWELVGGGNQGDSFYNYQDKSIMLKLYQNFISKETVQEEFDLDNEIQNLGIPAPKVLYMVQTGDRYGIVFQRINNKKSLCRIIGEEPERIPEFAKRLFDAGTLLHGISSEGASFPRTIDRYHTLDTPERQLVGNEMQKMKQAFELVEKEDDSVLIHGDFHFGNVITDGKKDYFIDLGTISKGNVKWDISMLFMMTHMLPEHMVRFIFHMSKQNADDFWTEFKRLQYGENAPTEEQLWKEFAPYLYLRTLFFTDSGLLDVNRRFRAELEKLF